MQIWRRSRRPQRGRERSLVRTAMWTGIPERPGRALRNAAAILYKGNIIWRTVKCLLPTYDVFDEDRYFEPGKQVVPMPFSGHKLAVTICEDIWNDEDFWPERLYRRDPVKEAISGVLTS